MVWREEEALVSGRWSAARELAGVGRDLPSTEVGVGEEWCRWEGKGFKGRVVSLGSVRLFGLTL
jgi:hypothetical protein